MADRKPGVVSGTLKKPLIVVLIVALVVLIAGFGGNFYLAQQDSFRSGEYLRLANRLKVLSQEIVKNLRAAIQGEASVFSVLEENRDNFDLYLYQLLKGNPLLNLPASDSDAQEELTKIAALWANTEAQVDIVLSSRDALVDSEQRLAANEGVIVHTCYSTAQ